MQTKQLKLEGWRWLGHAVSSDDRGTFAVVWNREELAAAGVVADFVQDNVIVTRQGALRGLHFQRRQPQGKLLTVLEGEVFEAVVDLRAGSPTFGWGTGWRVSAEDRRCLWLPPGFAHGFLALSEQVIFLYKVTAPWDPAEAHVLAWDDPAVGLPWPLKTGTEPVLSSRDRTGLALAQVRELLG